MSRAITAVAAIVVAIVTLVVMKRTSVASLFAADVRVRRAAACSNKAFFDSAYTVTAFAASQIAVVAGNFLKSEQVTSRVPEPRVFEPKSVASPLVSKVRRFFVAAAANPFVLKAILFDYAFC